MAPSRGKSKAKATLSTSQSAAIRKAPTRSTRKAKEPSPDVYGDMVAEAVASDPAEHSDRPLKRRKVARRTATANPAVAVDPPETVTSSRRSAATQPNGDADVVEHQAHRSPGSRQLQTIEASSDSDDSDFGFEDVDLAPRAADGSAEEETGDEIADISVSVAPTIPARKVAANRRKPGTATEKAFRLLVHKAHFLTLLGHCMYANSRCNNATVQKHMRRLLDKKMISYLNPKKSDSQFQQNRSFLDGLEQARLAFKASFDVTENGMSRTQWLAEDGDKASKMEAEPQDLADFIAAARDLQGSQDTGNQLFCAMLRASGVEARLVCSLQALPYANAPKAPTPKKQKKPAVFAIASDTDPNASDASVSDNNIGASSTIGNVPSVRRRLGQPNMRPQPVARAPPKPKKKPIRTLSYPVFWVEAFSTAHQKWVTIDAAVTDTVNKPTKIEPPASYDLNQLTYAIAFEADGVARDVTRRYAKAFNAKTRRQRVEGSGEDGSKWLRRALRFFRRRGQKLDRDQVEDAELMQKESREGLPSNVLDFKDHPYYALERHLKRHEVLQTRHEVGKVNAGTAAKPRMEAVFRRADVVSCKSADKWYRLGREIKPGEQPLKHVPLRRPRNMDPDNDDESPSSTALYAPQQTEQYVPPPVKGGRIPKNTFGNLDIYVPSMVPPGAVHIKNSLTQQAAKLLRIDYADAVTGFKFQGRHGTAIIEGAVVAQEYGEAVHATIEGFEQQILEDESKARSLAALRLWSRFLKGLRIAERVSAYGNGDEAKAEDDKNELNREEELDPGAYESGGFVLADAAEPAMPTAGKFSIADLTRKTPTKRDKKRADREDESDHYTPASRRSGRRIAVSTDDEDEYVPDYAADNGGGGFMPEDAEATEMGGGGFLRGESAPDDDMGGGFMADDQGGDHDGGGGFMPEDAGGEDMGGGFLPDHGDDGDLGGGFVPGDDGDNDMAGGFVPEDDVSPEPNIKTNEQRLGFPPEGENGADGGGFIAEDAELDHATAEDVEREESDHKDHATVEAPAPLPDASAPEALEEDDSRSQPYIASANGEEEDERRDSDRESLLSHDPEDDDAEPDWLESD